LRRVTSTPYTITIDVRLFQHKIESSIGGAAYCDLSIGCMTPVVLRQAQYHWPPQPNGPSLASLPKKVASSGSKRQERLRVCGHFQFGSGQISQHILPKSVASSTSCLARAASYAPVGARGSSPRRSPRARSVRVAAFIFATFRHTTTTLFVSPNSLGEDSCALGSLRHSPSTTKRYR